MEGRTIRKAFGIAGLCLSLPLLAFAGPAIPGDTVADEVLQKDIAQKIGEIQAALAPQCEYAVTDTRVKTVFELPSGLLVVLEEWVVSGCGKEIVYPVELKEDPGGGVDLTVSTPRLAFYKGLE